MPKAKPAKPPIQNGYLIEQSADEELEAQA